MGGISRRAASFGVVACILIAIALRLCALSARLPCDLEPDGAVLAGQVDLIQQGAADRDLISVWRLYPHLVSELAALIPARIPTGDTLEEHLAQASAPFVHVRLVSALLSLLGVPATYWLARRFLSRGPALLATFLSATSLLTTLFAQQSRPHGPAAALALLAIVSALSLARRPNWMHCTLAGIALGLSIGALQSGVAAALPVAAAWIFRDRERKDGAQRWLAPVWIALLSAGIAYSLYPHALPAQPGVQPSSSGFAGLTLTSGEPDTNVRGGVGHAIHVDQFSAGGFATVARSLISFETTPILAALVALLLGIKALLTRERIHAARRDLLVVGAYVLPYLLVIGLYDKTYERFCLQLIPFVACLAAFAWGHFAARFGRAFAVASLCFLALPPLAASVALEHLRWSDDGPRELAHWIQSHVAPETERVFCLPGVDVPLARSEAALAADSSAGWGTPWVFYQRQHVAERWDCQRYALSCAPLLRHPDFVAAMQEPLAAVRRSSASLVALLVPPLGQSQTFASQLAVAFQQVLSREGKREFPAPAADHDPVGQFTPGYDYQVDNPIWTWELLTGLPAIGSTMEMYRLR